MGPWRLGSGVEHVIDVHSTNPVFPCHTPDSRCNTAVKLQGNLIEDPRVSAVIFKLDTAPTTGGGGGGGGGGGSKEGGGGLHHHGAGGGGGGGGGMGGHYGGDMGAGPMPQDMMNSLMGMAQGGGGAGGGLTRIPGGGSAGAVHMAGRPGPAGGGGGGGSFTVPSNAFKV